MEVLTRALTLRQAQNKKKATVGIKIAPKGGKSHASSLQMIATSLQDQFRILLKA